MIKAYGGVYAGAWRYFLACPLLFAVPVAAEFVQHAIEIRIGMYDSIAAAQAVEGNVLRLAWGVVKVLSLFLAGYWVPRFLLLPGGAADARRLDPVAARLFAWVLLFSLAVTLVSLLGGNAMHAAGLGAYTIAAGAAFSLASFVFTILLAPWKVGAALGNAALGFVRSIRMVGWGLYWGIIFALLVILPPMVLHYAFAIAAIGNQPAAIWALMAVDALLVGFLGAIIAATDVAIARRAVQKGRHLAAPPLFLKSSS